MELPSKFTALVCCIVLIVLAGAGTSLWGQTAGFAYVANFRSGDVSAYTIDGATGALMEVDGSPFPAGSGPWSVTVDPAGRFAYVANQVSFPLPGNVSAFAIDGTTGALTPVAGSPFLAGTRPSSVAVDPTGRFAYVANFSSNNVSAYTIAGTTGALTPMVGSPFPMSSFSPTSVTVHPAGQFAYVTNEFRAKVSAYTIDGTTGALTEVVGSPFGTGPFPISVTVDPSGQFAYVANDISMPSAGSISAYTIDGTTGALTEVAGSAFPAGVQPVSVTTTAGPQPPPATAARK